MFLNADECLRCSAAWGDCFARLCGPLRCKHDGRLWDGCLRMAQHMRFSIRQFVIVTLWNHYRRLRTCYRKMMMKHEVNNLSDHVDHFGVSVAVDQTGISSDVLICEGRLFARLWQRLVYSWMKIVVEKPLVRYGMRWLFCQIGWTTSV
jgi:hypothetical protein